MLKKHFQAHLKIDHEIFWEEVVHGFAWEKNIGDLIHEYK